MREKRTSALATRVALPYVDAWGPHTVRAASVLLSARLAFTRTLSEKPR